MLIPAAIKLPLTRQNAGQGSANKGNNGNNGGGKKQSVQTVAAGIVQPIPRTENQPAVLLGASPFSTFSLIIACMVKTRERFMGIGQVLTMPLFFASNAIYPVAIMPPWLQVIARLNPLSYQVDLLRTLMVGQANAGDVALDFAILIGVTTILIIIGARVYPRAAT